MTAPTRNFVPDPPPRSMNREESEWILRQLRRIQDTQGQIVALQTEGGGDLGIVQQELDAHIQNETNPHSVDHAQLSDTADPDLHPQSAITDLETDLAGRVLKAGDTMTGDLVFDSTAGVVDAVFKGDPIDLANPNAGAGLYFVDLADVEIGGMGAILPDPADPDFQSIAMGSLSGVTGIHLIGAFLIATPENIAIGTPGAVIGSRLICSGFDADGLPILGWEDPPIPAYSVECENATDFLIHSGTGTGAWVEVCSVITTVQIEASQTIAVFWNVHLDNLSSREGTYDVTFTGDADAPATPDRSGAVIPNMDQNISGSPVIIPSGIVYPIGTEIHYWVRATGSHAQFNLWASGTSMPARMLLNAD